MILQTSKGYHSPQALLQLLLKEYGNKICNFTYVLEDLFCCVTFYIAGRSNRSKISS